MNFFKIFNSIPPLAAGPPPPPKPPDPGPPAPPDLTDQIIWAAQRAEMMRAKTGRTRQSTFGAGPMGALPPLPGGAL